MIRISKPLTPIVTAVLLCSPIGLAETYEQAKTDRKPTEAGGCQIDTGLSIPSEITDQDRPTIVLPLDTERPVTARAEQIEIDSEKILLKDSVYLKQGDWQAFGQFVAHQFEDETTRLEGPVGLIGSQFSLAGKQADLNFKQSTFSLTDADYALIEDNQALLHGQADSLEYRANRLHINHTWLTSCPDQSWSISARSISVKKGSIWGTARDSVFRIGKLPILYLPWLRFPVSDERQSGFLLPDLQIANGELDIKLPLYLNLARHYDAIIAPRWIADRGLLTSLEVRHLTKYMSNEWQGAYIHEDEKFDRQGAEKDTNSNASDSRWHLAWRHQGNWPGQLTTFVQYGQVSDDSYFKDFGGSASDSRQGTLNQTFGLVYDKTDWFFSAQTRAFQTLDQGIAEAYDLKPALRLNIHPLTRQPLKWRLDGNYTQFDRKTGSLKGLAALTGNRLSLAPRLLYRRARPYGYIHIDAAWRYRHYDLKDNLGGTQYERRDSNGLFKLDATLKLQRRAAEKTAYEQILIPRLYYLWSERTDQSDLPLFDTSLSEFTFAHFRENRFTGDDRLGDAHHLDFGITSFWKDKQSARETAQVFIGSQLRFRSQKVTATGKPGPADDDRLAPVIVNARLNPTKALSLSVGWGYRVATEKTSRLILDLNLKASERKLFNLSYKERQGRKRTGISVYWPLPGQLQLGAAWHYDLDENKSLERLVGLEYNHCCWRIRLGWHNFVAGSNQSEDGIFLQISLKGLGRFRSSGSDVYRDAIKGFREPEEW